MTRFKTVDPATLSPERKAVYDRIVAGPRGRVEGPLRVWLESPELAERAQALGAFCRFGSSLPQRLSELAIIVVGAYWRAKFEWFAHAPLAVQGGVAPAAVEAIRTGTTPHFDKADEQAVYALTHALMHTKRVPEPIYRNAVATLGETAVVEVVAIAGYYCLVSATLNTFEIPLPAGVDDPFPDA